MSVFAFLRLCCSKAGRHLHQTDPEGAVRQQLFVYLDLTCNYVCDRLHRVEKTYLALLTSQSSKGARCPSWLQLCSVAVPSQRQWEQWATRISFKKQMEATRLFWRCRCVYTFHMTEEYFYITTKWLSEKLLPLKVEVYNWAYKSQCNCMLGLHKCSVGVFKMAG